MKTTTSFAPLAGRLTAKVAEIRPTAGAEINWANFMALFFCAIFEMLIALCEALDARAAAEAARLLAAPAPRKAAQAGIPAHRLGRQMPSSERRAPRLTLVPELPATIPSRANAPSEATQRPAPRLVWSRDPGPIRAVHAPPWRRRRETRASAPTIKYA